ncbi:degenerin-like protein unc-105 [Liolophura sinensis]|uniref:degenerin-like protein unc-105 n=1 Tax=Liolophura sinensis TaxID=3198878 RepID=UPI003158141B
MAKHLDARELFGQFTSNTSLHGVKYVSQSSRGARRYFWVVALVCMSVLLVNVVVNQVEKFTSYPFYTVNTLRQTHSLPFPSVTICNSNLFRKSVVIQDPIMKLTLRAMYDNGPRAPAINFSDPRFALQHTEHDLKKIIETTAHQLESMFRFCSWMSDEVNCSEYLTPRQTNHGLCYTFNSMDYIKSHGRLNTSFPGELGGLELTIDIEEHEYFYGLTPASGIKGSRNVPLQQRSADVPLHRDQGMYSCNMLQGSRYQEIYLCTEIKVCTAIAEIKVLVHDPHISPNIQNQGFLVGPGSKVSASTSITKVKCLPAPYKAMGDEECLDTEAPDFESPLDFCSTYDIQACHMECASKAAIAECGCQDVFDHAANVSYCSIRELIKCYRPSKAKHYRSVKSQQDCKCLRQCNWNQYDVRLSSGGYPMECDIPQIMEQRNISREYVFKNYLSVSVFFDQLVFTEIEQVPSYTAVDIVANLGGQLGIFLGASFLTLTEVVEYIVGTLCMVCYKRKKTLVQNWTADNTEKKPDTSN